MNTKILIAAIISFGCTGLSLYADQSVMQNGAQSAAQQDKQVEEWKVETAQTGKNYVEGLDKGNYAQSWTQGDQIFQHTITQKEWERALNDSRKKLGGVKSRALKDQKIAWDPQGLPKGAYMVVEYDTSFDNAPNSGEILTMRRGSDGKWRVLTYQVN